MSQDANRRRNRAAIVGLSWIGAHPAEPAFDPILGTAAPATHASAMATIPDIDVVAVAVTPKWTVDDMVAAFRELLAAMNAGGGSVTSAGETARRTVATTDAILRSQAGGNIRVPVADAPWSAAATAAAAGERPSNAGPT